MRQRFHEVIKHGGYTVDKYPMIDIYIPDAVTMTNADLGERNEENALKWGKAFHSNMDTILVKKGLRVAMRRRS